MESDRDDKTDLIHELKVRRLVDNQSRLGFGMLLGFPATIVLEEGVRILAGGKSFGFILWMVAIWMAASPVCLRFMRGWNERSIRRRHRRSSRQLRKWLDNPNSIAVFHAMMIAGIIAYVLLMSIIVGDVISALLSMSSMFAFGLIWGGLRWRTGDDLVCARCDYNKTPESGDICPECGSVWISADTLALGRPAVVPWMIVAGVAGIGVDLAMVAMSL